LLKLLPAADKHTA